MCVITTIPASLNFFKGQLAYLNETFDVTAISSCKEQLVEIGQREGIKVYYIPMKREISLWKDMIGLLRFIGYFIKTRPYIVHGNTPKGALLSMVAAKLTGVPRRIYMCHGLRYQGANGYTKKLLILMEKITCKCATEILCVSNGLKAQLVRDDICNEKKSKVVLNGSANGINITYYDKHNLGEIGKWREKLGFDKDDFIFTFVGRVVRDKGINEMAYAFNKSSHQHPNNIHLIVVGPEENSLNPISNETRKILSENRCIHIYGRQNDVRPYMMISNVFILPSYREGFGLVLMEAGALGVPCITTNIIGCAEIIKDGLNGKIVPPRDREALYETMKWFYEHRDNEVKEMAAKARPMIIERYEQHKVWEALLKEYASL